MSAGVVLAVWSCFLIRSFAMKFARRVIRMIELPYIILCVGAIVGVPLAVILYVIQEQWGRYYGAIAFWAWIAPSLVCEIFIARRYYYTR